MTNAAHSWIRRILVSILAVAVTCCSLSVLPVFAKEQHREETDLVLVEERLNRLIEKDSHYSVGRSQLLDSLNGGAPYLYCELSPKGYCVYNIRDCVFEEIAVDSEYLEIDLKSGFNYVYAGPQNLLKNTAKGWYNIRHKEYVSEKEVQQLAAHEASVMDERRGSRQLVETSATRSVSTYKVANSNYFTSLLGTSFGENTTNTCTHVACGILLRYYDYYYHSNYVPVIYENGYGTTVAFHQYMIMCMGPGPLGIASAASGLHTYFASISVSCPTINTVIGSAASVYSAVQTMVKTKKRPLVAAMFETAGAPSRHSVVVFCYYVDSSDGSVYYRGHTGWYSPSTQLYNKDWFRDALYLPNS